jgi:hypothetical protein
VKKILPLLFLISIIPLIIFGLQRVQNLQPKAAEITDSLPNTPHTVRGIADILVDDFETGNLNYWTTKLTESNSSDATDIEVLQLSPNEIHSGAQGTHVLHARTEVSGGLDDARIIKELPTQTDEISARLYIKILKDVPQSNAQQRILAFTKSDDGAIAALAMRRTSTDPYNNLLVMRNGKWQDSQLDLQLNTWYYLEMHVATGVLDGRTDIWIKGGGVDTSIATPGINMGSDPITGIEVGLNSVPGGDYYIDDLAVDDVNQIGEGPVTSAQADLGPVMTIVGPTGNLPQETTSTTLQITTDVNASCKYNSVSGKMYADSTSILFTTTNTKTHTTIVSNLTSGKQYMYYIKCKNIQTNLENTKDAKIQFSIYNNKTSIQSLELTATYHSISVYGSFADDQNENNNANFEYQYQLKNPDGSDSTNWSSWKKGMEMAPDRRKYVKTRPGLVPNAFVNQFRASILMAEPDTLYQVKLTFSDRDGFETPSSITQTIRTRSESFSSTGNTYYVAPNGTDQGTGASSSPWKTLQNAADSVQAGDTVLVRPGIYKESVKITKSGSASNYIYFRPENMLTNAQMKDPAYASQRVVIDAVTDSTEGPRTLGDCGQSLGPTVRQCAIDIAGSFIRLSGFEIIHGDIGVRVASEGRHVVIENNYFHDQANHTEIDNSGEPSVHGSPVIFVGGPGGKQANTENITIQGNELVSPPTREDAASGNITVQSVKGGLIIRNNKIINSFPGNVRHGSDCITGGPDFDSWGGYYKDTDIYNNECIGATDEGIELDGGNMNIRVWNNRIHRANLGFSVTPVIYGPVYVFRNLIYDFDQAWTGCIGIKSGVGGGTDDDRGYSYFYHNTFSLANMGRVDGNTPLPRCGALTITARGTGYTSAPEVKIVGGGPSASGAQAVATIKNGAIDKMIVVNGGNGYTTNPTVEITGGGGTGATAKIDITAGSGNIWSPNGDAPDSENLFMRNNILHGYDRTFNFFRSDTYLHADYDMLALEKMVGDMAGQWANAPFSWNDFSQSTPPCTLEDLIDNPLSCQEKHGLLNTKASFVNPLTGDFRLQNSSPGIDKGQVLIGFNDTDSAWPAFGTAPDIGAYESGFTAPSLTPSPQGNGDANNDGSVNNSDILTILHNYLRSVSVPLDQFTDGRINALDFVRVLKQIP